MNRLRLLLLFMVLFLQKEAPGQSFAACEKRLEELLPEFNRAIELQEPHLLKQKAYRKKLGRLQKAYTNYRKVYYSPGDSNARANNEAVILALSGHAAKSASQIRFVADSTARASYHRGLALMLAGRYAESAEVLQKSREPNAGLNSAVSVGYSRGYSEALRFSQRNSGGDPTGKGSYNEGLLYLTGGDTAAAFDRFTKALAVRGEDLFTQQRGDLYLLSGSPEKALEDYRQISKRTPSSFTRQGNALVALGRFSKAIPLFRVGLESGEKDVAGAALLGMGNALYGQRAYSEAKVYYQRASRHAPFATQSLCGTANVALAMQQYTFALTIFDRVLTLDTTMTTAYVGRGIAKYGLRDYTGALRDFERTRDLAGVSRSELADVLVCRGYCHYYTGDRESARTDFERAVGIDPARYEALAGLGKIEIDARKYAVAGQHLSKALAYYKENDRMWVNYGNLLLHFGMFDKAFGVFRNAIELNSSNLHAQNGRGITLLEKDRLEESRLLFDSLLRTNPGRPLLLNNRGIVHAYLGNRHAQYHESQQADKSYKLAEADFNQAMQNAPARKFYHVNKGNVFRYWQQYDDARLAYQSYQDKSALNNTAVLLAGLERMKDARYYLGVALQIDSTHRVFQYNMRTLAQGKAREMARFVASARDQGPYTEISLKYSLDGYVTIYLYDYEYEDLYFPGRHHLSLPVRAMGQYRLIPEFDFSLMPFSEKRPDNASVKRTPGRLPKLKLRGRPKNGTRCPVLF